MELYLSAAVVGIAGTSLVLSPRTSSVDTFYLGRSPAGTPPSLLTLTLSQVTTWIFARSLLNAAILGYFFGLPGTLAYAAYYLSFLTGGWIVEGIRFRHGFQSVQAFLAARFGLAGVTCYNMLIAVRLVSEVFANLLVVGLLFGADGSMAYVVAVVAVAVVAFIYSMRGGLHASLRTDVLQMVLFLVALVVLVAVATGSGVLAPSAFTLGPLQDAGPGWVLLAVALLQVWSYPLHDPVMMDRGFVADRRTTRLSFYHAAWLSIVCVIAFGSLGVVAGHQRLGDENLVTTLTRLLGDPSMLLFNIALIISAMSTLDSAFASAAKLSVVDMRLLPPGVASGRLAMAVFLIAGIVLVFLGSRDLFSAVAVSGTAALYLAPVTVFSIWLRLDIPVWSYLASFAIALAGAALYFAEESGYLAILQPLTGLEHKYSKLLLITACILVSGALAFVAGAVQRAERRAAFR
jgi:Na+/proline symporter